MKTNAPGNFGCETYLKSWELGFRSGSTLEHTLACPFCKPLIHGGTEDCRLALTDEVNNIRRNKQRSRRKFLTTSIMGIAALFGTTTVVHSFLQAPAPSPLLVAITNETTRFETIYSNNGVPGIISYFAQSDAQTRTNILEWIPRKRRWALLDLAVTALEDKNEQVRIKALIILMNHTPKLVLKPHVNALSEIRQNTNNRDVRSFLTELIEEIELS